DESFHQPSSGAIDRHGFGARLTTLGAHPRGDWQHAGRMAQPAVSIGAGTAVARVGSWVACSRHSAPTVPGMRAATARHIATVSGNARWQLPMEIARPSTSKAPAAERTAVRAVDRA